MLPILVHSHEWEDSEVYCEDCGSHSSVYCEGCGTCVDLAYEEDPRDV